MSFTSTPSVGTRTVLALVVELFFLFKPTSMENILQSIVKIIIIGSLCTSKNVDGNRQFLPPPLPYYQNDDFFLPGFVPQYYEPVPVYFRQPHAPPPISYQNVNSYTPPQLFHQNENYNPAQLANSGNPTLRQPIPNIFHYKPNLYQPFGQQQKNNFEPGQMNYKKPVVQEGSHTEASQKKPAFYATNIIVKEENQPPYYHDEYHKNYHEEDYTDNYSDETPPLQEPCLLNTPYRYFESPKTNPNDPNVDKLTLCNPYFQPNFGNNVYTVKMPITLLPSRFPPRVEQLIERIQNYFSTYTQQAAPNSQNVTSPAATVQPAITEAVSQSETPTTPTIITGDTNKRNTTTEIEELTLVEANSEPNEAPPVGTPATVVNEQVTQKTIVVEVEATEEETFSTVIPETHIEAYIEKAAPVQQTTHIEESEKISSAAALPTNHGEVLQVSEQNFPTTPQQTPEGGASSEKTSENQISQEWNTDNKPGYVPATETQPVDVNATEIIASEISSRTEESNPIQPTKETLPEVTDTNG